MLKSHYGAKHKMVTSILIGIGAFIIFSTATWLYLEYSAKKFHIFLANANGYLQATSGPKEEDMHRHIVSAESFKISSQPLMLAFGIDSEKEGAVLHNARLNFNYYGNIPIQIIRTHLDEEGHFWHEYKPGTHYFYEFRKPLNGRWTHSWGSLIVTFPKPGEYRFDLEASADEVSLKTFLQVTVDESSFANPSVPLSIPAIASQFPSVLLLPSVGQLDLHNKGANNLHLWGTKFNGLPAEIEKQARIIGKGTFYYFFTEKLRSAMLTDIGPDGEKLIPFEVYIADDNGKQYIANFNLLIKMKNSIMEVHTQQLGVIAGTWEKG